MTQLASRVIHGTRKQWQRLTGDDKGSMIALLAVLPVLAGAVAIGVETGQLYRVKRQMQASADAAALAGAIDRMAGKTTTVIGTDAKYEAQRNGFTDGSNGVVVTVNAPPTSGTNTTTTGAVEVIITKTTGFSLGAVLISWMGGTPASFDIRARSVAAQGSVTSTTTSYEACMVALTTAAEQGISVTSFNSFDSDCTIASDGSSTSANSSASVYLSGGNNSQANLKSIWSKGSIYYGSGSVSLTNAAKSNQTTTIADPYSSLATPSPGSCTYTNFVPTISNGGATLSPGTYCGGVTLDGHSIQGLNNVDFNPGTYYIANGDLYVDHVNGVTCSTCVDGTTGVTFVLTQTTGNNSDIGGLFIASDNNVTLSAPPSGTYAGVLAYQDRRATVGTMASTGKIFSVTSLNNAKVNGAIYFPNNKIVLSNLNTQINNSTACTVWIGRYINVSNYNKNYVAGCGTFGTSAAGITTTTTTTKGKVME